VALLVVSGIEVGKEKVTEDNLPALPDRPNVNGKKRVVHML
jgi:hypothetical protein